jgi:hypothetical protein
MAMIAMSPPDSTVVSPFAVKAAFTADLVPVDP